VQTERLAGRALVKGLTGNVGFQPHIESEDDGRALPSLIVGEPEQQLKSSNFSGIPLLTGVTSNRNIKLAIGGGKAGGKSGGKARTSTQTPTLNSSPRLSFVSPVRCDFINSIKTK